MSNNYQFHLSTHVGMVRTNNEDSFGEKELQNGHVFVVCDGMGGHSGGEIASQKAVECVLDYFTRSRGENPIQMIHEAIKFANSQVHGFATMNPEFKGMGTTCVVVFISTSGQLYYGHVGDSRLYRFNRQGLKPITKDHSYVQYLVDSGEIQEHEMESHPAKNQILRALGIDEGVKPEVCPEPIIPQPGDTFLLCTDGLNGMIGGDKISSVLQYGSGVVSLSEKVDQLIQKALEAGGKDNVTVALIAYPPSTDDKTIQISTTPHKSGFSGLKNLNHKMKVIVFIALLLISLLSLISILRRTTDQKSDGIETKEVEQLNPGKVDSEKAIEKETEQTPSDSTDSASQDEDAEQGEEEVVKSKEETNPSDTRKKSQ